MVDQPDDSPNLDDATPSSQSDEVRLEALQRIDELLTSVEQTRQLCFEGMNRIAESKRRDWAAWAGPRLLDLLASREETMHRLGDENPLLRKIAIALLLDHWQCVPELASTLRQMAVEDPDPGVQEIALLVLASFYSRSRDRNFSRFLSQLVSTEGMPVRLRQFAYNALFQVEGKPVYSWPTLRIAKGEFAFPDDVDWGFVKRFL
jgi:hypothetical protein